MGTSKVTNLISLLLIIIPMVIVLATSEQDIIKIISFIIILSALVFSFTLLKKKN